MVLVALAVTFGTASMLQVMAVASHKPAERVIVEANKPAPAAKQVNGKERMAPQVRTAGI